MAAVSPDRIRREIVSLSHRGLRVPELSIRAAEVLRRAIPFDGVCVMTMDPATLLPTGHVVENGLPDEVTPRLAEIEMLEDDYNKFTDLAQAKVPAASLLDATGGDLERSLRQRELRRPNGFGDELRAALATDAGVWGGVVLMRDAGRPHFAHADTELVASVAGHLAEGVRRAILMTALSEAEEQDDVGIGLLLLTSDNAIESANPAASRLLAELREPDDTAGEHLPLVINAVADHARNIAAGRVHGEGFASARVRTQSGRWLLVRGSLLGEGLDAQAVVILEALRAHELAPLIADAYGFTERERTVTQLVAQGLPTRDISRRLHISPYTVQDHLKSIFEKTGVGSRGELVARVFFDHYAPRLADGPAAHFAHRPPADMGVEHESRFRSRSSRPR